MPNATSEILNPDTILFRFMDLAKFLSMVLRKALYFANPTEFKDRQEGLLLSFLERHFEVSRSTINWKQTNETIGEKIRQLCQRQPDGWIEARKLATEEIHKSVGDLPDLFIEAVDCFSRLQQDSTRDTAIDHLINLIWRAREVGAKKALRISLRKHNFISCWHQNSMENDAMWRLYGEAGIAIKSTLAKLQHSVEIPAENGKYKYNSKLGAVKYKEDLEGDLKNLPKNNVGIMDAYFIKSKYFAHEAEIRYVIRKEPQFDEDLDGKIKWPGEEFKVDLESLISHVIISPYASSHIVQDVQMLLAGHNLNLPVEQSDFKRSLLP